VTWTSRRICSWCGTRSSSRRGCCRSGRSYRRRWVGTRRIGWRSSTGRRQRAHSFSGATGQRSPARPQSAISGWCAATSACVATTALTFSHVCTIYGTPSRCTREAGGRFESYAARLTVADLDLGRSPAVRILGKGNKTRLCPLWTSTASTLKALIAGRSGQDPVFLNRCREGLTRIGICALVRRCAAQAARRVPSIGTKRVSPHVIRHTTAVHLLRAGVDINTIRAWLGHVSLDTTNIYAEVDLEMKAKALSECSFRMRPGDPGIGNRGSWPS
jgi:hypothetical protein